MVNLNEAATRIPHYDNITKFLNYLSAGPNELDPNEEELKSDSGLLDFDPAHLAAPLNKEGTQDPEPSKEKPVNYFLQDIDNPLEAVSPELFHPKKTAPHRDHRETPGSGNLHTETTLIVPSHQPATNALTAPEDPEIIKVRPDAYIDPEETETQRWERVATEADAVLFLLEVKHGQIPTTSPDDDFSFINFGVDMQLQDAVNKAIFEIYEKLDPNNPRQLAQAKIYIQEVVIPQITGKHPYLDIDSLYSPEAESPPTSDYSDFDVAVLEEYFKAPRPGTPQAQTAYQRAVNLHGRLNTWPYRDETKRSDPKLDKQPIKIPADHIWAAQERKRPGDEFTMAGNSYQVLTIEEYLGEPGGAERYLRTHHPLHSKKALENIRFWANGEVASMTPIHVPENL